MSLIHWGRDEISAIWQTSFLKRILLYENYSILIHISTKIATKGPIDSWLRIRNKPLSEPMMAWFAEAYGEFGESCSVVWCNNVNIYLLEVGNEEQETEITEQIWFGSVM